MLLILFIVGIDLVNREVIGKYDLMFIKIV